MIKTEIVAAFQLRGDGSMIKTEIVAAFQLRGDGSSTSVSLDLRTTPFLFSHFISPSTFANLPSSTPDSVEVLTGPAGMTASISGHTLSLSFATAPGDGSIFDVQLGFIYS